MFCFTFWFWTSLQEEIVSELKQACVHKNYSDTNLEIEDNLKNWLCSSSKVQE